MLGRQAGGGHMMSASRTMGAVAALALLIFLSALASCGTQPQSGATSSEGLSLLARRPGSQIAPFKQEHLPSIVGNPMHEAHFAAKVHCGTCHLSTEPLPPDRALEVCASCHPKRQMAKSVWASHCLSCHYFTPEVEHASRHAVELTQVLCLKCHKDQDPMGGHLYASCTDTTGEMVLCDHCHRPHDATAPAAIEICVNCHKDLAESRHPRGTEAKCSLCHKPHSPTLTGDKICVSCHGQAQDVLVHRIPTHPKDCLQCHKAHFTTIQIKGVCSDCHEGMIYRPGLNVPPAHEDCQNCHKLSDFKFKGVETCAGCHKSEGAALRDRNTPQQHKRCITCHTPHTWRASFSRNCDNCHELGKVLEHNVPYHPKTCESCHNPHQVAKMPKSGNCDGCHMKDQKVPPFGTQAPIEHRTCENCHKPEGLASRDFTFVGTASSCLVCHTDAASGMDWNQVPELHRECLNCHTPHTFALAPADSSCNVCHADKLAKAPNDTHQQCFNCHAQNHTMAFAGAQYSCQLCHPEATSGVPNEMHMECSNCHLTDHSVAFAGIEKSCRACHGTPPGLHEKDSHADCLNCHQQHTFAVNTSSCRLCHGDLADNHYPQYDCTACHFFSAQHAAAPVPVPAAGASATPVGPEAGK